MTSPWHTRNTAPCGTPRYPGAISGAWLDMLLLLVVASSSLQAETLFGQVIGVSDGDTVTVIDANKASYHVRLAGIDAPEKKQPFGDRSKQALRALVFGKHVEVEWHKRDRYDRLVGKILVAKPGSACSDDRCPKALDVSLSQIEAGLAWHYKKYANEQTSEDRVRYSQAEDTARAKHLGLWSDRDPVPPWEWRKSPLK